MGQFGKGVRKTMKKCFIGFIMLVILFASGMVYGEEGWKTNKFKWEKLIPEQDKILRIDGGDINGDLKPDIVVVYNSATQRTMMALVTCGDDYIPVTYDLLSSDVIDKTELSRIKSIDIQDNTITATLDFNVNKLVSEFSGVNPTVLKFKYLEDKIKLTDLVSTGKLSGGQTAHLFYNVREGLIYYSYLAQQERVGGSMEYYYRHYSRVVAPAVKGLTIDCDPNKWLFIARPQQLKNTTVGHPVTYGFEKWSSEYDLSGKFYLAHDSGNIYILVHVTDDMVRQNLTGDASLRGDHIEVWFANDYGNRYQLGLSPGNFSSNPPEALLWFSKSTGVGGHKLREVQVKSKKTELGYILEARIPIAVLGGMALRDITKFTIVLSDSDHNDRQEKIMASSSLRWGDEDSLGEIVWK